MLPPKATVREALNFCVKLKLPLTISDAERAEAIERAVRLLKLEKIVDAIIGSPDMEMFVNTIASYSLEGLLITCRSL